MPTICSRIEARDSGSKKYFTGKPCRRGHTSERFVSNNTCVECHKSAYKKWREAHPEDARRNFREWDRRTRKKQANSGETPRHVKYQKERVAREPFWKRCIDIKVKCKREDIPFDLTPDYLLKLYEANPICPVFGVTMRLPGTKGDRANAVSVDRIDPKRGYVRDNIALISFKANRIKDDITDPEIFRRLADWLEENQQPNN